MQSQIVAKTNEAFKAAEGIYNRLLNHRQFTAGELRYFVKEFEERRNDREVEAINKSQQTVEKINESIVSFAAEEKQDLKQFNALFDSLIENGNKIIAFEQQESDKRHQQIQQKVSFRLAETERIECENKAKFQEIDELFANKELELKKYYEELESKWNLNSMSDG